MISEANDITLRRDPSGFGLDKGGMMLLTGDKRHFDTESKMVDYQKQVYNLQNHAYYLERQLERLITINPEMQEALNNNKRENIAKLNED